MRITFKLFAMLTDYLPRQVEGRPRSGNVIELDLPEGSTVQQVIDQFKLPARLVHLVLIDGTFIPREQRESRTLVDGQTLAIWPPVAGG